VNILEFITGEVRGIYLLLDWVNNGLSQCRLSPLGASQPPHSYRFLKYLAIGRRTKPAFS
jgi:hypothetical protein